MEFKVRTVGVVKRSPNEVQFNFNFVSKHTIYNTVVELGATEIVNFKTLLKELNIDQTKLKTTRYKIIEQKKVKKKFINPFTNREEVEYEFSHYECQQSMSLIIDYNKNIMFDLIEKISELKNTPTYNFSFKLKDKDIATAEEECTEKAIKLALEKANVVKNSINYNDVIYESMFIVDYFETTRRAYSPTDMMVSERCAFNSANVREQFNESITPEDIEVRVNIESIFDIIE